MQITIFGATGQTGQQLVKDGLALGHTILAYGRNVFVTKFPENEKLILKNGALFDDEELRNAMEGADAVITALEGAKDGEDFTRSLGMKHIVNQMKKAGVKRIIALGGYGILDGMDEQLRMFDVDFDEKDAQVSVEHLKALQTLETSGAEWTMVATKKIHQGDPDGNYVVQANVLPEENDGIVSTGNLALFCLTELEKNNFVNQRVGIANKS